MPFKNILSVSVIFLLGHFSNYAQRINYSNTFSYNPSNTVFKVAGKVGNNIHIWKFILFPDTAAKEKSPISILVYSDQMQLIAEIPTKMMDETIVGIDEYFQVEGNIYYAYIKYFTSENVVKRQVLKIDENGNVITISSYTDAPEEPGHTYVSEKYPYIRNKSAEYYATTASLISDTALIKESLAGKNLGPEPKNLFIYKKELTSEKPSSHIQYSSTIFNFTNPHMALNKDNTIWACASNKPDFEKKHWDSSMLYSLFLTKLDSNLHEISGNEKFLKINAPDMAHHTFYKIANAFAINKNLFLVSLGNHLTASYSDNSTIFQQLPGQRYLPPVRMQHQSFEIKSLRLLKIDESGNSLKDTIINTDFLKAKLQTDNSFYSLNDDGVDLFYLQQFPRNFDGILHISFSEDGVRLNDVPVNPKYIYMLQNSVKIDEKTFVIPFSYNDNIGFMKWVNTISGN